MENQANGKIGPRLKIVPLWEKGTQDNFNQALDGH